MCDAIDALSEWLMAKGYKPFHRSRLDIDACELAFWTNANKHKQPTNRDREFLRAYVMFATAAGAEFSSRGIKVEGRGYVRPDLAVMNSRINGKLVKLVGGTFRLTIAGLSAIGFSIPN